MGKDAPNAFSAAQGNLTREAGLDTGPVPLEPYRSAEFFALERERIFRRAWIMACRVEELASPGDYVLKRIDPCNASALISRSKEGRIQAFHNTCSHRGSAIVSSAAGNQSRFVCPYHNWTYANDGQLIGMPDAPNFFIADKAKCGLKPIATEIWDGWVFINLAPEPEVSLAEFLGDFKRHFGGVKYQGATTPVIFTADLNANWKVVLDAFIESYHIPFIHPQTIGTTFAGQANPFARLLSAKLMGPHVAVSMFGNPDFQINPNNKVENLAFFSGGPSGNVISAASLADSEEYLSHPAINPTRSSQWSMDVNQLFPHTQIDCGPGGFWTHQFWPVSPNTCRYEGRFYMNRAENMRERLRQELYIGRVTEVILEDLFNVGRTQAGIDTGGQSHMQLQDSEIAIRHSVNQVIRWTEAATVKEALA